MVMSSTFMGGYRAKGACPCASSRMVMPNDQMSAEELYLRNQSTPELFSVTFICARLQGKVARCCALRRRLAYSQYCCLPLSLLHDFWSHPAGGANKGIPGDVLVSPGPSTLHLGSHPKIRKHHIAIRVDKNVACLQHM